MIKADGFQDAESPSSKNAGCWAWVENIRIGPPAAVKKFYLDKADRFNIFHKHDIEVRVKLFLKVMKAASDPTRVKILKMLEKREMCVCEIHTALGTAQSTASKHLKILEEAGLVVSRKKGLWVNYLLADGRQNPYAANLLGNLRHWLNEAPEIADLSLNLFHIDRHKILGKK